MSERRAKYNARKTEIDGHIFASGAEARRYQELKILERAGEIDGLELQPEYPLVVNNQRVAVYIGDFLYVDAQSKQRVLEDVKSTITRKLPVYRLKKKLLFALYGIEIVEVAA